MFICPECNKEFDTEAKIVKHLSFCWREGHPNYVSKSAPKSENIEVRQINEDMKDFFNHLGENNK